MVNKNGEFRQHCLHIMSPFQSEGLSIIKLIVIVDNLHRMLFLTAATHSLITEPA